MGDIPCSDSQQVPSSRYLRGSAHIRRTPGREGCHRARRENSVRTRQGGRVLVKPGGLPSQSLDDASLFITRDNAHLHLRLPQCEAYPWPKVYVGRPYPCLVRGELPEEPIPVVFLTLRIPIRSRWCINTDSASEFSRNILATERQREGATHLECVVRDSIPIVELVVLMASFRSEAEGHHRNRTSDVSSSRTPDSESVLPAVGPSRPPGCM